MEFMEQQMDNSELTIDAFAEHLMMSRTIFYRKLKSIIGLTPVDFIREIRIKRAVQLIDSGEYNFSQIAYMTGFSDPKYFSKCFKKRLWGSHLRNIKEKMKNIRIKNTLFSTGYYPFKNRKARTIAIVKRNTIKNDYSKMKKQWIIACLAGVLTTGAQAQQSNYVSEVWIADQGNGPTRTLFSMQTTPTLMSAAWVMIST